MGNWKVWILVLIVLAAGVWYVQHSKGGRVSASEPIFTREREAVKRVTVTKRGESVVLQNDGSLWHIVGNDSLAVRENRLDDLFDRVLKTRHTTMMTENPERWGTYSVEDSTGTVLTLQGWEDQSLGTFVFGSSMSDGGKSYVRIGDGPEVYLTDSGVVFHLNTMDTFWGEVPKPAEVDSISAAGDAASPSLDSVQVEVDYE